MVQRGARPWWRLEPGPPVPTPSPLDTVAFRHYGAEHYRDSAAIDQFLWEFVGPATARQSEVSDPVGPGHFDAYGSPQSPEAGEASSWTGWFDHCMARAGVTSGPYREWFLGVADPQLLARFEDDKALAGAIPAVPGQDPAPGAVLGMRSQGCTSLFESVANLVDRTSTTEHARWVTGVGLCVYDAPLFWLPGSLGAQCLTSEAPEPSLVERIRLPFDSVLVGLARPVPAAALGQGGEETWRLATAADGSKAALEGESHLAGLWLAAGEDGLGLSPVVVWFVETGGGVSAIPGVWERSAYAGAVANIGAMLTWETWTEQPGETIELGEPGSRERRKALKKAAVRKAVARGGPHRVRVLTFPQREPSSAPAADLGEDEPGRASPVGHWRRGHWTKVRMATRGPDGEIVGATSGEQDTDWHYEGRWIRPVFVNPEGPVDPGVKVYQQVTAGSDPRRTVGRDLHSAVRR